MLTGCHKSQILSRRWDDVDRTAGEFRPRDGKRGPRMVPLTTPALKLLDGIERTEGTVCCAARFITLNITTGSYAGHPPSDPSAYPKTLSSSSRNCSKSTTWFRTSRGSLVFDKRAKSSGKSNNPVSC